MELNINLFIFMRVTIVNKKEKEIYIKIIVPSPDVTTSSF
jgi:hypothetical protein